MSLSPAAMAALERARSHVRRAEPTQKPRAVKPAPAAARPAAPKPTGPINRFMYREGRLWAIDMVRGMRNCPAKLVVFRLLGAITDRPESYAEGVRSVIKELTND